MDNDAIQERNTDHDADDEYDETVTESAKDTDNQQGSDDASSNLASERRQ